jgi:hypothetical protein
VDTKGGHAFQTILERPKKTILNTAFSMATTATLVLSAMLFAVSDAQARPKNCNTDTGPYSNAAEAYCLSGEGRFRVKLLCRFEGTLTFLTVFGPWVSTSDLAVNESFASCPKKSKWVQAWVVKRN